MDEKKKIKKIKRENRKYHKWIDFFFSRKISAINIAQSILYTLQVF